MPARIVPAAHGARWLADGWRIFRAAPFGWLATVLAYLLLTNLVAVVPIVGVPVALVLVQPLSFGLMTAAHAATAGQAVRLPALFAGFRQSARTQLALGVVYALCSFVVYGAMSLADSGGTFRQLLSGAGDVQVQAGDLLAPLAAAALAYTPVMMAFWFAPALAGWQSMGTAKSLFFSFAACALNWRPFLAYGAAAALVLMAAPFLVLSLVLLASGGSLRLTAMGLVFPLLVVMLPTLFASFYASYRDIFGESAVS